MSIENDFVSTCLASLHAQINEQHEQSRLRLMSSLGSVEEGNAGPRPSSIWGYAVGGVGALATTVLLLVWLFGSPSAAVAMERLAVALNDVTTYSYRMEKVFESQKGTGRKVIETHVGCMRTNPIGLHAHMRIVETLHTQTDKPLLPKILTDLEESHAAGTRGVLVDHLKKQYRYIDEQLDAETIGSPLVALFMVRQHKGRVSRDLGKKQIDGRSVRGLQIVLDTEGQASDLGPASAEAKDWASATVEVWVDPKTNLPVEFERVTRGEGYISTICFTNLKWNVVLDENAFIAKTPTEYHEKMVENGG